MDKEARLMFLTGLLSTRGEITEDFVIDYYMGISDTMLDFGFWLDKRLTSEEFDTLLNSNRKDQVVMEYYRLYKNQQLDWTEHKYNFETIEQLKEHLSNRAEQMRRRWALEKKTNGGFTMMDHWTLNPEALTELLRPGMESIERGDVVSSDEFFGRLMEGLREGLDENGK